MYVEGVKSELYSIQGPSIQSNITHVGGVKSVKYCTTVFCMNKRSKVCQRCQKCIEGPSIQSNVTPVEGVKSVKYCTPNTHKHHFQHLLHSI